MTRLLPLALALPLAACGVVGGGDGPSEKDIADALTKSGMSVKSVERIACKTAPDRPGYVCDFRVTSCSKFKPSDCSKSATRTGRFVLFGENWVFRDDVADPNRYAPKEPPPGDIGGNTVTDMNGTPVAGATPTATPSPTPSASPSASPTPKPTPSATPSATPSPKPSPTATPKPPMPAGVNKTWLIGRWSDGPGNCAARKAVNFGPGGGFYGKRGLGRWSLDGKTVSVKGNYATDNKPFDQTLRIERTGDNSMTIEGKRYQRCDN